MLVISSTQNPRVKEVVRLRKRSHRDQAGLLLVEGYRELQRGMDNGWKPAGLFHCPALFLGTNEHSLLARARDLGANLYECTAPVFRRISYRERPEGLLAVGPQWHRALHEIALEPTPLIVVAESIEKPGNLGTILRSADAAGVNGVIVCDRCTDVNNPNVVRSSTGTLFSLPVVEASSDVAIAWLREHGVRILASTPRAETLYSDADLRVPVGIVVGTEQYGLSETWMSAADLRVRIPMRGQADSLNVASAATILLYEAVRQRGVASSPER